MTNEISEKYAWWRRHPAAAQDGPVEAPDVYDVYARLSFNDGKKESCERQIADCTGLAGRLGLTVAQTHVDDNISAWQKGVRRPGWEACLARIRERLIRGVIVWHGDRFIRKPEDLIALLEAAEAGAIIHSYGSGQRDLTKAADRRILWYEVIHADASSEDTSRRVKAGLADAAAKGRPAVGRRGYGYGVPTGVLGPDGREIVDKRRVVHQEAEVIREAVRRVLAGGSLNSICNDLTRRGVPTIRGGSWEIQTLRGILASPRIAGLRVHQGRIVGKGDWPAIIEESEWRQLLAALAAPRVPPQAHPDREYLLTGLAVCGSDGCGTKLAVQSPWEGMKTDGRGRTHHVSLPAYYRCRSGTPFRGCGRNRVIAEPFDRHVAARLRALAADPAVLAASEGRRGVATAAAAAEMAEVDARMEILSARWGRQEMTTREYDAARSPLVARRAELEARLAGRDRPSPAVVAGGLVWDQMEYPRRRMFARALVDAVIVAPNPRRLRGFDPGRVEIRWR